MQKHFQKDRLINVLVAFIAGVGLIVVLGWIFDIDEFKSIHPGWVTMKITTAIAFIASVFILHNIRLFLEERYTVSFWLLPVFSLSLFAVMSVISFSALLGVDTGIENILIQEDNFALLTSSPGRPSIGTLVGFLLISLAGILAMFTTKDVRIAGLRLISIMVILIGAFSAVGYIFDIPTLYYAVSSLSTAMALHTTILFILSGLCLFEITRRAIKDL